MNSAYTPTSYPAVTALVEAKAASRIHDKDASLYSFSSEAEACAEEFMGWTDLAENPPYPAKAIKKIVRPFVQAGFTSAILIGQGGSTQASMVLTKYFKDENPAMAFYTLDSDSPVRLHQIMSKCELKRTLVIVSSKSGSTLEMRLMLSAVRDQFLQLMNEEELCEHLVAITDPGSSLAERAVAEGWAAILYGEATVGGRFSALSVFGLVPAALVGIPLKKLLKKAAKTEQICSMDSPKNPAIQLAAFLYDNYWNGRKLLAYASPKRGRALGLWIEQLVAESTGKQGQGILPYLEVNPLLLSKDYNDRMAIIYKFPTKDDDADASFMKSISYINKDTPRMVFTIESVEDIACHFVMWEYAVAMCGYLMQVCPFDQPDVASAKACVVDMLDQGMPEPDLVDEFAGDIHMGSVQCHVSECCKDSQTAYEAIRNLLGSIRPGDYFAINAFLPFVGDDRKRALESIRSAVATTCGVPSCLEIGPRYLHSTGQLQKGGANNGVYLVISADEPQDIALVDQPAESLGALAQTQATGDAVTLAKRGRRVLHLHLPDNYGVTLGLLAALVNEALADLPPQE